MLKRLSIRQLLLLAFLLAGLLPAMLVSFLSFFQARDALKKEIKRDMQTLSQTVATDIERLVFERAQNVHSWSQLAIMQDISIGDIDKRVATFLQELTLSYGNVYHTIYVLNNNNIIVASSNAQNIGKSTLPLTVWFKANLAGKAISFAPIQHSKLALSQAIIDSNTGQNIGLLVAEFNWQIIQQLLNDAVKKPAAAVLLDESMVVNLDNGVNKTNQLAATTNWNKVEAGNEMRAKAQLSNQLGLQHWQVRIAKLHSVAVAPVHRLGYVFLALLLATLLFAALLVKPIAEAITQPLEALREFVKKAGLQGAAIQHNAMQASIHAPAGGPPEVQALSNAFEKMMQDLQKTQANLTRAAKLAVVGEMSAAMSHEVRTPLGILRSSADLLLREPKLTKEGKEVLGFIISETERLNKLVSTLIDAARPRTLNRVEVNLTEIAANAIALLKSQAQTKNITILFDASKMIICNADADQMTQVVMNLLMNALQILPNGGKIELRLQEKKDADGNEMVIMNFMDDGPGILAENQAQIFEPFFTQRTGGVGLGLAVVRQIVQAHGGEISYQTSAYNGAQFSITLPKAHA